MLEVYNSPDINILGVLAVASNTNCMDGARVDLSVTDAGAIVKRPVNKDGKTTRSHELRGDTVELTTWRFRWWATETSAR